MTEEKVYTFKFTAAKTNILMAGLGKLPGEMMYETAKDLERQVAEQNAPKPEAADTPPA